MDEKITEREIRALIDELGFEWYSVRTWVFERAYGVQKIRFTISQSRTQKDYWIFTIKSNGYIQQTRTNKLEEIWNEIHDHF